MRGDNMTGYIFHNRLHWDNNYSWLPGDRVIITEDFNVALTEYYDYCTECADYMIQYLQEEIYETGTEATEQWYLYETAVLLGMGKDAFIDYIAGEVDMWCTKDIIEIIPEEMTDEDRLRAKGVIM